MNNHLANTTPTTKNYGILWRVLSGTVSLCLLVGIWKVSCDKGWLPSESVPSPVVVWGALQRLHSSGMLWSHTRLSVERMAVGLAIGSSLGLSTGILIGGTRIGAMVLQPVMSVLAPVPPLVWTPILIAILGIDNSRVALVSIPTFFIVTFGCVTGIRATDRRFVELAQAYGLTRFRMIRRVLFPSAMPSILSSLRTSAFLSWTILVFAEMIAASAGLGWLINDARTFGRTDDVGAGVLVVAVLAIITDFLLSLLQRRLTMWQSTFDDFEREVHRA